MPHNYSGPDYGFPHGDARLEPTDLYAFPKPATLRRVEGELAAGTSDSGETIVKGASVSTGREARVTEAGDYRFFAGWRSPYAGSPHNAQSALAA
jgi:hypothetical protein